MEGPVVEKNRGEAMVDQIVSLLLLMAKLSEEDKEASSVE